MRESAKNTLRRYNIKVTRTREALLGFFFTTKHALSHIDVEKAFHEGYDRVTLYRTLRLFEEKGLLHLAEDGTAVKKYALTESMEKEVSPQHIHFICKSCKKTFCLGQAVSFSLPLPLGFQLDELVSYAKGCCAGCSAL